MNKNKAAHYPHHHLRLGGEIQEAGLAILNKNERIIPSSDIDDCIIKELKKNRENHGKNK